MTTNKKRALVTGIAGFVGSHLTEHLLERGIEVHGLARWRSKTANIDHLLDRITLVEANVLDRSSLQAQLTQIEPDYVFHLAGESLVPTSYTQPQHTIETNLIGTLNLFEAIRQVGVDPVIQIAGSSEQYGYVEDRYLPTAEDAPFNPLSPYAVSKVAMDFLGYQYYKSYGLRIIRSRAFNHEGPRRPEFFVTSYLAREIALIEKGKKKPVIPVGNLEAKRDYTDVRDMARAYLLLVEKGESGEAYNLCSGVAYKIRDVLDMLVSISGQSVDVEVDPERLRPADPPILLGDSTKFRERTGWAPAIPFEKTMADLLDYWRDRV